MAVWPYGDILYNNSQKNSVKALYFGEHQLPLDPTDIPFNMRFFPRISPIPVRFPQNLELISKFKVLPTHWSLWHILNY